ncbi:hypothetical protein BC941DRAFT_431313 [Chlamydoabsidia padenii]|nr:hypothetical protein BC941DRAFT_431313 [Chlamydoabsidia padenii]
MNSYQGLSSIELLLDNLNLLGFDPIQDATNPLFQHLTFDTTLFTNNTNNDRAFECLSYFLFNKLSPDHTRFAIPIQVGRTYRMVAYRWLLELKEQGWLMTSMTLRQCDFETCPDSILGVLVSLSILVLQTVMDRELTDPSGRPLRLLPEQQVVGNDLKMAIRSLAHYSLQQQDDFKTWVGKSRDKAMGLQRRMDRMKRPRPDLKTIRKRLIHLQQKHPIRKQVNARSTDDHRSFYIFPSLVTPRDLDPSYDIKRIHDFVHKYVNHHQQGTRLEKQEYQTTLH